jgi:predicted ester cyclase
MIDYDYPLLLEANAVLLRDFMQTAWCIGDFAALERFVSADVKLVGNILTGAGDGLTALKGYLILLSHAFPALDYVIESEQAFADSATITVTYYGAQWGDLIYIPASGRWIEMEATFTAHIRDGKIARLIGVWDADTLMQQLKLDRLSGDVQE